ncbi:MAG: flavin reductase family protein [bacterium]
MIKLTAEDISNKHHIYRINLINSCSGFKSANLIGTRSTDGFENVAVFSSVTHFGSNPPLLGFVLRPTTVLRNTYENLKETGFYTINHIHESIISEAHHTSAKYPGGVSEFTKTKLDSEYKSDFHAPFVKYCPVQIAMKFEEEYHIKANDTILVLGSIQEIYIEDELLSKDGFIDLAKGNVVTINGLDAYVATNLINRFEYQRPKKDALKESS